MLTTAQCDILDTQQCKYLRKLLCGKGCLKILKLNSRGGQYQEFHALPNCRIRQILKVATIQSELTVRRLRWLQCMVKSPQDSEAMMSALQGFALWEKDATINADGSVSESANPWTKQFYSDLKLLSIRNHKFAEKWNHKHWWAIYSDEFQAANVTKLRSFDMYPEVLYSFKSKDVFIPFVSARSFGSQIVDKALPFPSYTTEASNSK